MKLEVMEKSCSLYRLDENREVPREIYQSTFFSATKTDKELSIICDSDIDISCCTKVEKLKLLRVNETIEFDKTGIISAISEALAKNDIPLLAQSTCDTIYVIIKEKNFEKAVKAFKDSLIEVAGI